MGFFRAHVAYGAVHQLQAGLNCPAANYLGLFRVAHALDMGVRAEFKVNLIHIINGVLCHALTDKARQIAADLVAQ